MNHKRENFRMVAKTFAGLEKVLADEIRDIGGENLKILQRAVEFEGDTEVLYKANYLCRCVLRILKPIATFKAPDETALYNEVKKIQWDRYLDIRSTFSIDGNTSYSNISHSKYLALKSKDAIVDQFRQITGKRPNVERYEPDLKINVRIFKNFCTVSLDSSGESLHKRGYRVETGPAPLNEVLAAGMIKLTGWNGNSDFIDPMCGSGTLPIEAALIAKNHPSGYFRETFAFMNWKDFDESLWVKIKSEAENRVIPLKHSIIASDRSGRIIQSAKTNIHSAGLEGEIKVQTSFFDDMIPPSRNGVLVTNPPYGERIKTEDITRLYKEIGDILKKNYSGYSAWIISSHLEAIKHVGLRTSSKIKLYNGPLECRFVNFELYSGSKKQQSSRVMNKDRFAKKKNTGSTKYQYSKKDYRNTKTGEKRYRKRSDPGKNN